MPEGTIVFANEPVVQVVAPLPQAQLVETYVLNQIHLQSVAATKAARGRAATPARPWSWINHALVVADGCHAASSNGLAGHR